MNAIRQDVETLVQKELESANKKFPSTFRNRYEAYGVMLKEFEEVQNELRECEQSLNGFKYAMKFNGLCREDMVLARFNERSKGICHEKITLDELKENAENLMVKAGQLAAMAQKALNSTEEWYKDGI